MTNLIKGSMIALGASSTVAIPLTFHLTNQPSTFGEKLIWDGKSPLPKEGKDNHWKAKFNDYGTEVKVVVSDYQGNITISSDNIKKLSEWCAREVNKNVSEAGYETYSSLCSTDLKTLKGRMISESLELASSEDDFKLLFINNKHIPVFLEALNNKVQSAEDGKPIARETEVSTGHPRVKSLCEKWFAESFNSKSYEEAKRRCVKSNLNTVKQKLIKLENFQEIKTDEDYKKIAAKWKEDSKYKEEVTGTGEDYQKLKNYCELNMNKKLIDLTRYDDEIKKIRSFCDAYIPVR